uniref:Cytochrome c oxidase subunit 4 isoform 1, mitochondrial n=1 Tax=Mandrillus leucophaeus TaxID=9568 RepID=A0A2K6ACZ7_MANLE
MLATRVLTISTSVCVRAHESVVKSKDFSLPTYVDRRDYALPDVAHVKQLSALKEKEKASCSSLSTDEKVECSYGLCLTCVSFIPTKIAALLESREWERCYV